ncbi:MAG: hypothetical protein HOP16_15355 [Acidobacteria bacterium]|nr:hypothetical protein [Acidobacteriota bacterium]
MPKLCLFVALFLVGSRLATAQTQTKGIQLNTGNSSHLVVLAIQPLPDSANKDLALVLVSLAPQCVFPERFELPVQLDGTAFQLKRMIRLTQEQLSNGVCSESLVSAYTPSEFCYLTAASSVVMHLPSGPVQWTPEAIGYASSMKQPEAAPYQVRAEETREASVQLMLMARSGEAPKARDLAEAMAPVFVSRPAGEGIAFFAALGLARRETKDLPAAAIAYEVATMIADASSYSGGVVGVTYDNLATVRRLLRQFEGASVASDRALAILSATDPAGWNYGGALNNRALLLADQNQPIAALEYSDRALVVLRQAFKNDTAALAPFLDDNQQLRDKAEGR